MNTAFLAAQRDTAARASEIVLDQLRAGTGLALETTSKVLEQGFEHGKSLLAAPNFEAGQAALADAARAHQQLWTDAFQAGQQLLADNIKAIEGIGQLTKSNIEATASTVKEAAPRKR